VVVFTPGKDYWKADYLIRAVLGRPSFPNREKDAFGPRRSQWGALKGGQHVKILSRLFLLRRVPFMQPDDHGDQGSDESTWGEIKDPLCPGLASPQNHCMIPIE